MSKGLVHLYCGDGKGKTTAAMGLALRAAGHGQKVLIVQFLKGRPSGEVNALQQVPGITLMRDKASRKFSWQMDEGEKAAVRQKNAEMLAAAVDEAAHAACDLLILDETIGACGIGLLAEDEVLDFIKHKPDKLELVLTGRNPSQKMLDAADYVTEMRKIKHPFDQGIPARKGVEY